MRFGFVMVVTLAAAGSVLAFPQVPKDSARALGVTRGKSFSSGLVFINGKYLPPPYVVERWGTGLRINGRMVTGQVIDWNEFLRTQSGVKVAKQAAAPAAPSAAPAAAAPAEDDDSPAASLDDLFSDAPKADAKPDRKAPARKAVAAPTVSYSLEGDFQPNAASKKLVARINDARTAVDARLRRGGFIFFGDGYSRVSGDAATALAILEKVPDLQQHSASAADFAASARSAGLYYLSAEVCADLFANRIDYRALQERRAKWRSERELERKFGGSSAY